MVSLQESTCILYAKSTTLLENVAVLNLTTPRYMYNVIIWVGNLRFPSHHR